MEFIPVLLMNAGIIAGCMVILWLLSVWLHDVSIVDMFWGAGFVLIAWATFLNSTTIGPFQYVLVAMISLWGLRLTIHLVRRNLGKGEDSRYRAMRDQIGPRFVWLSLLIIFGLQGALMLFIALPFQVGLQAEGTIGPVAILGGLVALAGFAFETVGDFQLVQFKRDPANQGKVLNRGLWRYTRHPNYFGDALYWWGIYVFVVGGGLGWWTALSPMLMSFLLMRVSGVALLEKTIEDRRPEYARYKRETSSFFPWPPGRVGSQK